MKPDKEKDRGFSPITLEPRAVSDTQEPTDQQDQQAEAQGVPERPCQPGENEQEHHGCCRRSVLGARRTSEGTLSLENVVQSAAEALNKQVRLENGNKDKENSPKKLVSSVATAGGDED